MVSHYWAAVKRLSRSVMPCVLQVAACLTGWLSCCQSVCGDEWREVIGLTHFQGNLIQGQGLYCSSSVMMIPLDLAKGCVHSAGMKRKVGSRWPQSRWGSAWCCPHFDCKCDHALVAGLPGQSSTAAINSGCPNRARRPMQRLSAVPILQCSACLVVKHNVVVPSSWN